MFSTASEWHQNLSAFTGPTPKLSRVQPGAKRKVARRLQRLVGPRGFLAKMSLHDAEPGDFAARYRSLEWNPTFHGCH